MMHSGTLSLPLVLSTGNVPSMMKTQRLTVSELQAIKTQCSAHPDVELRVIVFCPACRGQVGGEHASEGMTAEEKTKRAKKAACARWKKAKQQNK
jgi:hypothetical protein